MKMFHGSPELFSRFDLSRAGAGTGIKYGFGVYLTESERSADGEKNIAVFSDSNVKIEKIDVELRAGKWALTSREDVSTSLQVLSVDR